MLVTGAAGFVGRYMVQALAEDYEVGALGQQSRPEWLPDGVEWYEANLLSADSFDRAPDRWFAVIHLAGNTVPRAFGDDAAVQQNVDMTRRVLESVVTERFLLASSALVYAPGRQPQTEHSPIDPQGPYGRSKHLCEQLALTFSDSASIRIARPFNHIGPGMQPALAIPSIIERVKAARSRPGAIEMLGQDSVRDFVDVRDVVAAYRALIELDRAENAIFNVCTGRPVRISDVVAAALDELGIERDIAFAETALSADDTSWLVGDPSKLTAAVGWKPGFTLSQSVRDMLGEA